MKNTAQTLWHILYRHRSTSTCLLALISSLSLPAAQAETITIGKGKGVVWEGMPFNVRLSVRLGVEQLTPSRGLLAISQSNGTCQYKEWITLIEGYETMKLAPGIGLIPRASGTASYYLKSGEAASLTGTLGLPKTEGSGHKGAKVTSPDGFSWCLPPKMAADQNFYSPSEIRTARISGTWALIADGSQQAAEIDVPIMYAATYSHSPYGNDSSMILPANIKLRISTLECTVNTPSTISFGSVMKNTQAGAELGVQSYPLTTTCGQSSDYVDANINLQFRPITGLYNNQKTRLALGEGGGYITGEIDNSVTGSGSCTATSGVPFDNSPLKIGRITKTQTSLNITNQVTWRLCSGGANLPLGDVSAAAEMLVTFN